MMKKSLLKIFLVMLFLLTVSFTFVYNNNTNVLADEIETEEVVEPSLNIYKKNISYSSYIYIVYSVSYERIDTSVYPVKMLFFDNIQDEYTTTTATSVVETSGSKNIDGVDCLLFYSKGIAAKEMTDDIYARAYVEINDEIIYSEVVKYSVLEYYYEIKEAGTATTNLQNLLDAMINYGAAAQINFNYNMDRLANATYYKVSVENTVLPDGFTSGRFKAEEQVTLTAPEKEGYLFKNWTNANSDVVSTESTYTLTVTQDEVLTANYEEEVAVTPVTLTLTKEAAYDATADTLNLPTTVTFDYNNETVTENVTWDTNPFVVNQIGKQKLYGTLSNGSYNIDELSIEINVLPYTFSLDEETNECKITRYYGKEKDVIIPNTFNNKKVTSIGNHAFYNQSNLLSITIPSTVTSIGDSAFSSCTAEIIWDKPSITEIGKYAFYRYEGKSMTIPSTVTSIGRSAFRNCSNLISINIPEGVTSIGDFAFYGCFNLTSIEIPSGVTSIGGAAFANCNSLKEINVDVENVNYKSIEGVLFTYDGTILVGYPEGGIKNKYVIPEGVISIGQEAFHGDNNLTSITIPSSVTSIGIDAFSYCTAEIIWDNPTITEIGSSAFINYGGQSITIPESVTSIGDHAFVSCSNLTSIEIPTGVTSIGSSIFSNCENLTSISLPDTLTYISSSAFEGCINLYYNIYDNAKYLGNSDNPYLVLMDLINEDVVDSCEINEKVKLIASGAFLSSYNLENVYYEGTIESWCNISFYNADSNPMYYAEHFYMKNKEDNWYEVTEIVIPNTITEIGSYQFCGFENVTSITIPEGVTSIGNKAFYSCESLTSIIIPSSVTIISSQAFYYCLSLIIYCETESQPEGWSTSWQGSSKNVYWGINKSNLYEENNLQYILDLETKTAFVSNYIGNDNSVVINEIIMINDETYIVRSLANELFYNCSSLTSITIPSSVISIGKYAFYNCTAEIIWDNPTITEIGSFAFTHYKGTNFTIPSSVTSIGENAFSVCSILTNITIPSSVTSIGKNAFSGCSSLTSIAIPSSVTSIGEKVFYNCNSLTSITIPSSVTSIGGNAFEGCSSLTSITIPSSVTSIGGNAFEGCSSLTSITIPNSVTSIGENAFDGCSSLASVYYDGKIEDWCNISFNKYTSNPMHYANRFYIKNEEGNWYEVTKIEIPNTITKIGNYQFCGFKNVTSIIIPNSVSSIGMYAFYNCSSLSTINIPEGVTSIETCTFFSCSSLTNITILEGVTMIGSSAFNDCCNLSSIIIPSSVTSIGWNTFKGCTSLNTIYNLSNLELTIGSTNYGYVAYYAKYIHTELPRNIILEKEVAYDVAADSLDLPETVTFSYNEEEITLDVIWDTTTFVESQVGEQIIYGVFNDDELYDKYNIKREGIYIVIKVL